MMTNSKWRYRSGLEKKISEQIAAAGLCVEYEEHKINYLVPARAATYTPDFRLPNGQGGFFFVETKGLWDLEDRKKHLLIKEQYPELDIRLVFQNANAKIYKKSKTTYAMFCHKNGFMFAHKKIPDDWLFPTGDIL